MCEKKIREIIDNSSQIRRQKQSAANESSSCHDCLILLVLNHFLQKLDPGWAFALPLILRRPLSKETDQYVVTYICARKQIRKNDTRFSSITQREEKPEINRLSHRACSEHKLWKKKLDEQNRVPPKTEL